MKNKEQENKAVEKIEQITEKNKEIKPETSGETPVKNSTGGETFSEEEKERMRAEKEIERIKEKEPKENAKFLQKSGRRKLSEKPENVKRRKPSVKNSE